MRPKRYKRYAATFQPKRMDDLAAHAVPYIGQRGHWTIAWKIEASDSGDYAGQYAMSPYPLPGEEYWNIGWVPECDLTDWEEVPS